MIELASKMDQFDSLLNKSKEQESETDRHFDDKNLDLLNFYVKEIRQPKWKEIKSSATKFGESRSGECFNRTYLPNG